MRVVFIALTLFLSTMLSLGGCFVGDGGCPCGSDPSQPLSEHDRAFSGSHVVDGQCVCTCGEDRPMAYPADRPCRSYEGPCEDGAGHAAEQRCR